MLPSSGYKTKKVLYPEEGIIAETFVKTLLNSVDFTLHRDFNLYYQDKVNDIVESVRIRQFLPLIFST